MTDPESSEPYERLTPQEAEAFMFRFSLEVNLDHYVRFHNTLKGCLGQLHQEPELQEDPSALHTLKTYEKLNAANTVLLSLAYLEGMLIQFWKNVFQEVPLPSGSGVARFKRLFDELNVDRSTYEWFQIQDAIEVRHCILHTNGRVSFMRVPEKIKKCVERNEGLEINAHLDRIRVNPAFLKQTVDAIGHFRERMLEAWDNYC